MGAKTRREIHVGTLPSTEVLDLELAGVPRPVGLILLFGQVSTLDPLLELPGHVRIWMRWAEPEETGLEGARIEIAASDLA